MARKPVSPPALFALLAVGLLLPIAVTVVVAVAAVMGAAGDLGGSHVLQYVALAIGILWAIDLVCLVLAHGLNSLSDADGREDPPEG